jgi:hypothetical protein
VTKSEVEALLPEAENLGLLTHSEWIALQPVEPTPEPL